jgi:NAD-dependent DNA ligase
MRGTSKNKLGKTEKNAKIKEGDCFFPFKFKWKTHDACVETEKGPICATEINPETRTLMKYGYCEEEKAKSKSPPSLKKSISNERKSKTLKVKKVKLKANAKKIKLVLEETPPQMEERKPSKKISKSIKKKLILIEPEDADVIEIRPGEIEIKLKKKTRKLKLKLIEPEIPSLKISQELIEKEEPMQHPKKTTTPTLIPEPEPKQKIYNEEFIEILGELKDIMQAQGETFRAKAYQTAQETIMMYEGDITDPVQLKGMKGIGETILSKLNEYVNTGTLKALEKGRKDPVIVLTKVYGIGPKKAKDLIEKGITTIEALRENKQLLNEVQQVGLKYYDDILEKIPRSEIDDYKVVFDEAMVESNIPDSKYEIVGSYRRGKQTSGDIDVIITNENDNNKVFDKFIDILKERDILVEILTRGKTKSLTIAKLPDNTARRIDFLYTSPEEYPFAILYFTGSKMFNTVMRQRALNRGYTLNEHGISTMKKGVKGDKISQIFPDEKSIFDFLDMQYKKPMERIDGRAVQDKTSESLSAEVQSPPLVVEEVPLVEEEEKKPTKKNVTLKKKKVNVKDLLKQFKDEGLSALKLLSETELSEMIRYANNAYYCKGKPVMTDNQYDILREYTLEVYPSNEAAKEGHAGCEMEIQKNKVNLPYEMWSMDKIKPDTGALEKWVNKFNGPYVLSCKLDGVSGLYVTEGKTPKLYTRGDGIIGQDISHLIPYLRLPKTKDLAIRGEFIISKSKFEERYSGQFANPRNFVAGVINQKKVNPSVVSSLSFVAYEVIKPELVSSEQLTYLTTLDVEVVKYEVKSEISNELLSETLIKWRNEYEYEIDGIICMDNKIYPRVSGNPEHAFAFKMVLSEQVAEAKVMDVLWSPSKDGVLKPRVQIEPITLGGVKIEFATGFNAKFIEENNIGVGAVVQLVRSGDVIPHILAVTVQADKPLMPTVPYEWNETHVDIILVDKEDNLVVKEKIIELFFNKLGVEGLKSGKIKKLVAAGYDTVPKILRMGTSDFEKIEGFGKKSSAQIASMILEKLEEASLIKLMTATNFARGLGEKKFGPILEAYPDILTSDLSDSEKVKQLITVKGVAENTAVRFVSNIREFLDFLNETGLHGKLGQVEPKKVVAEGHPLFGKKIIMTGFRDKNLESKLEEIGAELSSAVSKNVFVVLVKDLDETTGKAEKARQLGIPLMTPEEFKTKYDL